VIASASRASMVALVLLWGCAPVQPYRSYRVIAAPEPQALPPRAALGSWESSFGRVEIEADAERGGLEVGAVRGTWTYWNPQLLRVVRGFFYGTLRGTLLRVWFTEERTTGFGFLELSPHGDSFEGRWWNHARTQTGLWRGWRLEAVQGGV
jgi:hypothetical protein